MQVEAPQKTAVIREKPSQWVTADATDLQPPGDSGLAQVGIFTCSSPPEVPLAERRCSKRYFMLIFGVHCASNDYTLFAW